MKKRSLLNLTVSLILFLLASCSPKPPTPDSNTQIRQAVAATLSAIPTPTFQIPPTPYPSPTPFSLTGLYCEYKFCVGHPASMAFYDHLASLNQSTPSTYNNGFIIAFQIPTTVISMIWLQAPGTSDPKFLLDTILEDGVDTPSGALDVKLIRNMNVMYTPITTIISEVPFGSAAAWTCGDRVFAWKSYTPQAETAGPLFDEAFSRFTCE